MFKNNKKVVESFEQKIDELLDFLKRANIHDLSYILGSRKEIIKRNLLAGIFRGVGIGIGVTLITAILIFFLQKLVKLNIPVVGEYISDIIDIVQNNRLK